jgi:hypothetical protein
MTDLTAVIHDLVGLFDRLRLPYAITGRPRDLLDIEDVLFMQGQLDETYMRRWAGPLGVADQLERMLGKR